MCLTSLLSIPEKFKKDEVFHGFKIFLKYKDTYVSPIYRADISFDKWIIDDNKYAISYDCYDAQILYGSQIGNGSFYQSGFHIFLNKEDLFIWASIYTTYHVNFEKHYKIFPISFKQVVAYGLQVKIPVIVARQIYIDSKDSA
jgi:hypothetical protein